MKRITQWSTKAVVHKGQLSTKGSQLRLAPLSRRQFLKATGLAGVTAGIQPPLVRARGSRRSSGEPVVEGKEIYLSDLEKCQPSAALSERSAPGVWRMLKYKSRAFSGTMLVATEESDAPDVNYALGRSGWHEIYIGIYRKPFEQPKQVQVKLSDDPAYTILTGRPGETDHQENWIDDIYWKTAHLNGRDIVIRQIKLPRVQHSWVGYIKLVPLSEQEVRAVRKDRSRTNTKRLFVHSDAHLSNVTGSTEEILKYLEPLRNTDVARIYWEAGGGDRTLYFSAIGRDHASALEDSPVFFPRVIDREWALTWQAYRQKGTDQLRVAAGFAKKIGLEFHAAYRTAGFVHPPPYDDIRGSFFKEHPELVCVAQDGTRLPRISYAFPETRRYVLRLFREMAEYPIDGVCVLYNRRPPLVAYEAPLVEGFTARYGQDPRQLDEHDPRWLSYRSSALTEFMRELRKEMDEVSQRTQRSQRVAISAVVFRKEENRLHGMDLHTWIHEGLVDTIIPYSSSIRLNSYEPAWENREDIDYFVSLVRGTNCRLALNLMPRALTSEQYLRKAHFLYSGGVENFFFWDGISRVRKVPRLGHRKEVARWITAGEPAIVPAATRLHHLGGWDLTLETPG